LRRAATLHPAVLATIAAAVVWPLRGVWAGGVIYERDVHLVWHPQVEGFVRAVAGGSWPLWDPGPGFGQPLLADPSAMVAYPLTWLNLLMPAWLYYSVFAVVHLAGTTLGLYLLARRWHMSVPAAAVAAACWGFSGPVLSLVNLWHHYASAAWIPWAFLAAERAMLRRTKAATLAWCLTIAAQILAGSADMAAMTGLAVAGLAAARHLRWRQPLQERNRRLLASASLAVAGAVGLSAVLWAPALEGMRRSARWGLPEAMRTFWSVHPLGMVQALVPDLWYYLPLKASLRALLSESREQFLVSLYLGMSGVALVAVALAGRRRRLRVYLAALGLAAALIALGRHGVFYSTAVTLLPPLRILRYPMKAFVFVAFPWALLCGMGVDAWRSQRTRPRAFRVALAVVTVLALSTALAALAIVVRPERVAALLLQVQVAPRDALAPLVRALTSAAGAATLAAALLALRLRRPSSAGALALAAGALAALDCAWFNRDVVPTAPRALYARPPVVDALRADQAQRVYVYDYAFAEQGKRHLGGVEVPPLAGIPPGWREGAAVALAQQMHLMPPAAGRWNLPTAYESDLRGLYRDDVAQLVLLLNHVEGTPLQTRLLRQAATTHVVALHEEGFGELRLRHTLQGLFVPAVRVFSVPGPLPLAYAVSGARGAEGRAAIAQIVDPAFDPAAEVVVPGPAGRSGAPGSAGRVTVSEKRSDRVRLRAEMERDGWVVLAEGYDPGWKAWLDGRRVEVLPANVAFRALRVPAGTHEIEMRFRPPGASLGASLTLATALALAAYGRRGRRPLPARA
jgi:hypothetical protein